MEGTTGDQESGNPVSQSSQTAADFIDEQLALEADAREILPYKFDNCTHVLGPLRQNVFACLTCNPPPASPAQVFVPAGVCYACSISCHGEHTLVELFSRRNFVCDCGTTRLLSNTPCTLRSDPATGRRGVRSQEPAASNRYNQNFQNRFCTCGEEYDAETEKGTMYQCLGLGSPETGGCGEDWYHPECLTGLGRDWYSRNGTAQKEKASVTEQADHETHPVPPGFPDEDDFDALICYRCVEANPWIKNYAGTPGFLPPVYRRGSPSDTGAAAIASSDAPAALKRKASDADLDVQPRSPSKRTKEGEEASNTDAAPSSTVEPAAPTKPIHKHDALPATPLGVFSLFLTPDFREHLCHCPTCYPNLIPHPQLVEEEDVYEPSLSSGSGSQDVPGPATRSHGSASLLERGEAALSTMDRVKAIEGVMVYNHLRDKVKEFLKPYAESGQAVSAEDIKAYFEKLRGDEGGIKEASAKPVDENGDGDGGDDNRREQSGY